MREALCREVGEAGAQRRQDPKGFRIPPSPSDLDRGAKEAPWLGPRVFRAISVPPSSVTRGFEHTWDIGLGAALHCVSPSPPQSWWASAGRGIPLLPAPAGPGSLQAGGRCGWERERERGTADRPGVGLRVPVTAAVTVALGNAFLRGRGQLLEVSREASPGAP